MAKRIPDLPLRPGQGRSRACRPRGRARRHRAHAARRPDEAQADRPRRCRFRRSCREGVCGSDAMNINGKNGLACLTNMRDLPAAVVLKPLPGLPVIRDLIVDMTQFFKQYHSIKPYLVNDDGRRPRRAPAVARGARRAQRPVRVHPVRQLLDQLPELLVEPGQVRRPGRPAAGLPLHRRQPRPGHRRASGQPGRPVPPVPLPHHHELRGRLPKGPTRRPRPSARSRNGDGCAAPSCRPSKATGLDAVDRRTRPRPPTALALPRGLLENDLFIERFFERRGRRLPRTLDGLQA